jgi:hypothetical protein
MTVAISATPVISTGAAPAQASAPAGEHQLFDYFVKSHLDSAAVQSGRLANPAALTAELTGDLAGFVQKAHRYDEFLRKRTSHASEAPTARASSFDAPFDLRPGPALQSVGLEESDPAGQLTPESLSGLLDRVVSQMHDSQIFHLWSSLVARGASEIPRTINTLLKSQ